MATNPILKDNEIALLLDIANMACHSGFPGQARAIVDGVLAVKENFVPALITKAYTHLVADEFDAAFDILDPILKVNKADQDALLMKGLALLLANRRDEAVSTFKEIKADSSQKKLADELLKAF